MIPVGSFVKEVTPHVSFVRLGRKLFSIESTNLNAVN